MADLFHELHPNGDVIFVVYKPTNEFAEWNDTQAEYSYWPTNLSEPPRIGGFSVPPSTDTQHTELDESSGTDGTTEHSDTDSERCEEAPDLSSPWTPIPLTRENIQANQPSPKVGQDNTSHSDAASEPSEDTERAVMRIRASSTCLILGSDYFLTMFNSPWKETTALESGKTCILPVREWDPDAFLILMNIIHDHNDKVPQLVELEMLAKIATLVDYYKCLQAVEPFWHIWAPQVLIPTCYSRNLILWLWASWAFCQEDKFRTISTIVMENSRGPIQTLGLPIPENATDIAEWQRQASISELITAIHDLRSDILLRNLPCTADCDALRLRYLEAGMSALRLLTRPKPPFLGIDLVRLTNFLDVLLVQCSFFCERAMVAERRLRSVIEEERKAIRQLLLADFPLNTKHTQKNGEDRASDGEGITELQESRRN